MGKGQSKVSDNSGTVINKVEVSTIHQAEVVNTELFVILYILVAICAANMVMKIYKAWKLNIRKKYMRQAVSSLELA